MIFHLLATLMMGAVAASAVWLLARMFKLRLPGYVYPAAAALGVLGYTVYDEYTWYGRAAGALPQSYRVVETFGYSAPWQPWTYAAPRVVAFAAVDLATRQPHPKVENVALVRKLKVDRNVASVTVSVFVDCGAGRYYEVGADTTFDERDMPTGNGWQKAPPSGALQAAVCG